MVTVLASAVRWPLEFLPVAWPWGAWGLAGARGVWRVVLVLAGAGWVPRPVARTCAGCRVPALCPLASRSRPLPLRSARALINNICGTNLHAYIDRVYKTTVDD